MSDEPRKIKLIKIVAYHLDHDYDFDDASEVKDVLENTRYANHCLDDIQVLETKSVDIMFTDDHELNNMVVTKEQYEKYFKEHKRQT